MEIVEDKIADLVLDICFGIHRQYGPGLLESVYEEIIAYEFRKNGLPYLRQHPIIVVHDGQVMDIGFRADFIADYKVIIELKSIERLADVHYKQLLTYLKLTGLKLGLLINFNEALLKNGIKRVVNNL